MLLSQAISKHVCYLFLFLSLILLLFIFSLISRVSPWADEWFMVPLTPMTFVEWAGWLFQQHNDHVILIQKLLYSGLIRASGYDFRSLILPNIFIIFGSAWAMLKLAEEYRGANVFTDVVIVLSLCCVGPNAVTWSSTFPFPATNLIIVTFALLWMRTLNAGPSILRALAAVTLLISGPFIAAGGAVATTMICIFLWYLKIFRKNVVQPLSLIGIIVASLMNVGFWATYRPSNAAGVEIFRIPDFVIGLSGSSIYWWGLSYEPLKDIVCTIFVVASIICCMAIALRRRSDSKDLVLAAAIFAIFAVMASIAVGRSAYTEWFSGLKTHYGIVSALLIPLGLLLFERRSRLSIYLSVAFTVLLAVSYVVSFRHQVIGLKSVQPANMASLYRLAHSSDLPRDMAEHWTDYWWRDAGRELAPTLAQRVEFIRENGGKLYKPWNPAN